MATAAEGDTQPQLGLVNEKPTAIEGDVEVTLATYRGRIDNLLDSHSYAEARGVISELRDDISIPEAQREETARAFETKYAEHRLSTFEPDTRNDIVNHLYDYAIDLVDSMAKDVASGLVPSERGAEAVRRMQEFLVQQLLNEYRPDESERQMAYSEWQKNVRQAIDRGLLPEEQGEKELRAMDEWDKKQNLNRLIERADQCTFDPYKYDDSGNVEQRILTAIEEGTVPGEAAEVVLGNLRARRSQALIDYYRKEAEEAIIEVNPRKVLRNIGMIHKGTEEGKISGQEGKEAMRKIYNALSEKLIQQFTTQVEGFTFEAGSYQLAPMTSLVHQMGEHLQRGYVETVTGTAALRAAQEKWAKLILEEWAKKAQLETNASSLVKLREMIQQAKVEIAPLELTSDNLRAIIGGLCEKFALKLLEGERNIFIDALGKDDYYAANRVLRAIIDGINDGIIPKEAGERVYYEMLGRLQIYNFTRDSNLPDTLRLSPP